MPPAFVSAANARAHLSAHPAATVVESLASDYNEFLAGNGIKKRFQNASEVNRLLHHTWLCGKAGKCAVSKKPPEKPLPEKKKYAVRTRTALSIRMKNIMYAVPVKVWVRAYLSMVCRVPDTAMLALGKEHCSLTDNGKVRIRAPFRTGLRTWYSGKNDISAVLWDYICQLPEDASLAQCTNYQAVLAACREVCFILEADLRALRPKDRFKPRNKPKWKAATWANAASNAAERIAAEKRHERLNEIADCYGIPDQEKPRKKRSPGRAVASHPVPGSANAARPEHL